MARGKIRFGRLVEAYCAGRQVVRDRLAPATRYCGPEETQCYLTGVRDELEAVAQCAREQQLELDLLDPPLEQIALDLSPIEPLTL